MTGGYNSFLSCSTAAYLVMSEHITCRYGADNGRYRLFLPSNRVIGRFTLVPKIKFKQPILL